MRKDDGFYVLDQFGVSYRADEKGDAIFTRNADTICTEVLAVSLEQDQLSGYSKDWNINGEKVTLSVERR